MGSKELVPMGSASLNNFANNAMAKQTTRNSKISGNRDIRSVAPESASAPPGCMKENEIDTYLRELDPAYFRESFLYNHFQPVYPNPSQHTMHQTILNSPTLPPQEQTQNIDTVAARILTKSTQVPGIQNCTLPMAIKRSDMVQG